MRLVVLAHSLALIPASHFVLQLTEYLIAIVGDLGHTLIGPLFLLG